MIKAFLILCAIALSSASEVEWWDVSSWQNVNTDLRYSTVNNVMKKQVAPKDHPVILHSEAAKRLRKLLKILAKEKPGYSIVIWDAWRTEKVQWELWKYAKSLGVKGYVSSPKKGSMHQFGMAIDATLQDEKGKRLDMGTDFDYFGALASSKKQTELFASKRLTKEQYANRKYWSSLVKRAGFYQLPSEWWHIHALPSKYVRKTYKIRKKAP